MQFEILNQRICGSCHACCDGWLEGEAYGLKFGNKKPCSFLCHEKCTIYKSRPQVCKNFYCAWVQGLFSEKLKPNESGLLVSVQDWNQGQFFFIIEMDHQPKEDKLEEIKKFCKENNTPFILKRLDQKTNELFGPPDFFKEKEVENSSLHNL